MGGGSCDDVTSSCLNRRNNLRPFTTTWRDPDRTLEPGLSFSVGPALRVVAGLYNLDDPENTEFRDANHVFARYCSSDWWVGSRTSAIDTTAGPFYFSGRYNVKAMLEALAQRYGLDDADPATRLLWMGESAGSIGAPQNVDQVVTALPQTAKAGGVKVLADAAWLSDWDNPCYRYGTQTISDHDLWVHAYNFWGGGTTPQCAAARMAAGGTPAECVLGKYWYPSLTDPAPAGLGLSVMVNNNSEDTDMNAHGITDFTSPVVDEWKTNIRNEMLPVASLFSSTEPTTLVGIAYLTSGAHTLSTPARLSDGSSVWIYGPKGSSFREVLFRFWRGEPAERVLIDESLGLFSGARQ